MKHQRIRSVVDVGVTAQRDTSGDSLRKHEPETSTNPGVSRNRKRLYADHTRVRGELSPEEVAEEVGCSVKTVRNYYGRALALEEGPIAAADVRPDPSGRVWLLDSVTDRLLDHLRNRRNRRNRRNVE